MSFWFLLFSLVIINAKIIDFDALTSVFGNWNKYGDVLLYQSTHCPDKPLCVGIGYNSVIQRDYSITNYVDITLSLNIHMPNRNYAPQAFTQDNASKSIFFGNNNCKNNRF